MWGEKNREGKVNHRLTEELFSVISTGRKTHVTVEISIA